VFLGDDLNYFWGIKKPVPIVLPVVDVVSEILREATANGIEVNDVGRLEPVGPVDYPLRHVANRNHSWLSLSPTPRVAKDLARQRSVVDVNRRSHKLAPFVRQNPGQRVKGRFINS
jgi:hypothetical protein